MIVKPEAIEEVLPIEEMRGDTLDETVSLTADYRSALEFMLAKSWCFGIGEVFFGVGLGGVISVFLVEIVPQPTGIDPWLWVIVGDVPPAYLVLDECPTPIAALETYINLMDEWVELARLGEHSEKTIPVNVPSTPENALLLEGRLAALRNHVLPLFREGSQDRP